MTETINRNAYLRVGAAAVAVFIVLLLVGAARGEGPVEPAVPANATPVPDSTLPVPSDRYRRDHGRSRDGFGGPQRGRGMPGGGAAPGGTAPAPAPVPDTNGGGTT